jgi:hypothetical protein
MWLSKFNRIAQDCIDLLVCSKCFHKQLWRGNVYCMHPNKIKLDGTSYWNTKVDWNFFCSKGEWVVPHFKETPGFKILNRREALEYLLKYKLGSEEENEQK